MENGILFSMITAPDTSVLAEYVRSKSSSGLSLNAKKVLQSIPKSKGEKRSYTHNKYAYNMISDHTGSIYLAVTTDEFSRVVTFTFLEALKKDCIPLKDNAPQMFQALKRLTDHYSDPKNDKIATLKSNIDNVKETMIDNIEKVLERGDKIDNLVEKTETLEAQSHVFQSNARALKRKMWWKRVMMTMAIVLVIFIAIFLVLLFACSENGVNFKKCGEKGSSPAPPPGPSGAPGPAATPQPAPPTTSKPAAPSTPTPK